MKRLYGMSLMPRVAPLFRATRSPASAPYAFEFLPSNSDAPLRLGAIQHSHAAWILCSVLSCSGGWVLSMLGQLNAVGCLGVFCVGLLAGGCYWSHACSPVGFRIPAKRRLLIRLRCRFHRPLPLLFLILTALATLGGLLHAPNNGDALIYRIPRILHWIAEGRWHWIPAAGSRLNYSATGFEWLMLPLLLFTGTDRLFFVINLISHLLLPGLIFSVFRQLGIHPRVAWHWMWLLPAGYCFVLQAGSVANDTFAATYLLASLHFALRARTTRRVVHLWLAILAAAVLTGAKASNLPLLLPCAIAALPSVHLLKQRLVASVMVVLLAGLASHLPMAAMNHYHSGHWSGDPDNLDRMRLRSPVAGLLGNSLQITVQNLTPPFLPWARRWAPFLEAAMPGSLLHYLKQEFPRFSLVLGELPIEEGAGLGFGITLLLAGSTLFALLGSRRDPSRGGHPRKNRLGVGIAYAGIAALLVYMAMLGSESAARLVAPYYPLLVALPLTITNHSFIVRARLWRLAALFAAASAFPGLIANPARPLLPAQMMLARLETQFPANSLLLRARSVYVVYANRTNALIGFLHSIPPNTRALGFVSNGDHPETSLWHPFGSRRIIHLAQADDRRTLQGRGIQWVVLSESGLRHQGYSSIEQWLRRYDGQLVQARQFTLKASAGPETWFVARIPPPG